MADMISDYYFLSYLVRSEDQLANGHRGGHSVFIPKPSLVPTRTPITGAEANVTPACFFLTENTIEVGR